MSENRVEDVAAGVLGDLKLRRIDAYWRAANYLSVGQIYPYDNPLLRKPLTLEHVKSRLLIGCSPTRGTASAIATTPRT